VIIAVCLIAFVGIVIVNVLCMLVGLL